MTNTLIFNILILLFISDVLAKDWYCLCYQENYKNKVVNATACRTSEQGCEKLSKKIKQGTQSIIKGSLSKSCRLFQGDHPSKHLGTLDQWLASSKEGAWWSPKGCLISTVKYTPLNLKKIFNNALSDHPQNGCKWISRDGKKFACIHSQLEMGYVMIRVDIHSRSGSYNSDRSFILYDGSSSYDKKGVKAKGLRGLKTYLKRGQFVETQKILKNKGSVIGSRVFTSIKVGDRVIETDAILPVFKKVKENRCCEWRVLSQYFSPAHHKLAVVAQQACSWDSNDTKNGCYHSDYCGDECRDESPDQVLIINAIKDH